MATHAGKIERIQLPTCCDYEAMQLATIASGKVTVPSNCWKVRVLLVGSNHVGRVSNSTRLIAVNTPNNGLNSAWGGHRTSAGAIEPRALPHSCAPARAERHEPKYFRLFIH